MITDLVYKYEAGGDPGAISTGEGDLGGVSYGIYQLASNTGAVQSFIDFAAECGDEGLECYGNILGEFEINSPAFKLAWKKIAKEDRAGFIELQTAFAIHAYYRPAVQALKDEGYDADHGDAMPAVLFSRAIQYGPGNMAELFSEAVHTMYNSDRDDYSGWPNLSYVNDAPFDYDLIAAIYDFLILECDAASWNGNTYHSPKDWANGSKDVIAGLRNRFVNEKTDALEMLK